MAAGFLRWQLLALLASSLVAAAWGGSTVHTIPTECKSYFSWQSLGMFYSHRRAGQPGPMTRILCCTKEEYERLSDVEKTLVPTHWAPSYTVHPRTGDVYHAYNKPLAVLDWISKTDVKEDFVLVIDADMIMRETFIPEEVGAKPGWAVAAYFGYMKGTDNQLALTHVPEVLPRNDTLAGRKGRRGDMAGGFTLMHREDLRRVAPLWLKYTERVREDPGAWNLTGDEFAKKPGDKPWISEMYGYSFGCAKADVWHITHSEHMLYPGYDTTDPPKVLHYGLHWKVQGTPYEFDKHWHFDFDPLVCPPWDFSADPRKTKKGLFAHPPAPLEFKTSGFDLLRDLLAVEPIIILNAAFCERHLRNCPQTEELVRECNRAHELEAQLDTAYKNLDLPDPCVNRAKECEWWASVGECEKSAGWMYSHCRPACKWCVPRDAAAKPAETTKEATKAVESQAAEATGQEQQQAAAAAGAAAAAATVTEQQQQQDAAAAAAAADQQQQGGGQAAAGGGERGAQEQQQQAQQEAEAKQEAAPAEKQEERQQQEATAAEGGAGAGGSQEAAAQQAQQAAQQGSGEGGDSVLSQHHAALTQSGEGAAGEGSGRAEAMLLEQGEAVVDTKRMPFLHSERFGVQAVVGHHIQMLAIFWGGILVAVLFKMRRRLFGKRPHHHVHARVHRFVK